MYSTEKSSNKKQNVHTRHEILRKIEIAMPPLSSMYQVRAANAHGVVYSAVVSKDALRLGADGGLPVVQSSLGAILIANLDCHDLYRQLTTGVRRGVSHEYGFVSELVQSSNSFTSSSHWLIRSCDV